MSFDPQAGQKFIAIVEDEPVVRDVATIEREENRFVVEFPYGQ
jgi:hypothetical protein